jgi:hypothetical protein
MANLDLMSESIRRSVIKEIKGDENKRRRAESLKRFEVYRERQDRYILEKLESEFSEKTVREMRKILSINLCPRIVDQLASIYKTPPVRGVANLTEAQEQQVAVLYEHAMVDVKLAQANKYFKLENQCAIQVVPRNGIVKIRVLLPHQYDVLPDENNPEEAYAYVVSVFDKFEYLNSASSSADLSNPGRGGFLKSSETMDGMNQSIADSEDYKASLERYEVWTKDLNFLMDGNGNIVSGDDVVNPIGELPFIDVACEKDFEFWIRRGNGIVDFAIDFGAQLSDIANIIRMQGYAQAVISAEKQPDSMVVGPNHILWLQLDANRPELKPTFEFVSPGSDLQASLDFLEMTLRLFLTSKGIDPKTVSGKLDSQSFSSGVERLLSMIDKFESSKSDTEIFRYVEMKLFHLLKLWSNVYQNTDQLIPELQLGKIPDDAKMTVNFVQPQAVQTKTELEDSIIKLLDKGLTTKKAAIMELKGIDEDSADEVLAEIANEKSVQMTFTQIPPVGNDRQEPLVDETAQGQ